MTVGLLASGAGMGWAPECLSVYPEKTAITANRISTGIGKIYL